MKGIPTLRMVSDGLTAIELPPLHQPDVAPEQPSPKEEFAKRGICLFVYSLIAHMQKVLAGLVDLGNAGNFAASAPVARHVFEWAALSCSVAEKTREQFKQGDWEQTRNLLNQLMRGSIWAKKYGAKYAVNPNFAALMGKQPDPFLRKINDAVEEYEARQLASSTGPNAKDDYRFLSDHSHPNGACLIRYHKYDEDGAVIGFIDPDTDPQESVLPFVNNCMIDLLSCACALLELAGETTVQSKLKPILDELLRRRVTKRTLTGSIPA